jgi:transcriptional regulator with GAF, ATPase, and Fis domain
VKGAFTGAHTDRSGRFELADGGTLFLDEIGELPLETQAKLLRVLQEREYEPVGSSSTQRVDVRVIAATNRDLERAVAEGRFRSDLYYRLSVFPIPLPPLRERREDLRLLIHFFVERFARQLAKRIEGVSETTFAHLLAYDWPGNVRELQNVIERAMVVARGPLLEIGPELLPVIAAPASASEGAAKLEEVTRQHVLLVLERCGGVIDGPQGAAKALGLSTSTLRSRMKKLGIARSPGAQ